MKKPAVIYAIVAVIVLMVFSLYIANIVREKFEFVDQYHQPTEVELPKTEGDSATNNDLEKAT